GWSKDRKVWGMNGSTPPSRVVKPTATTRPLLRAVTPLRTFISPMTYALETRLHRVPLKCSIRGRSRLVLGSLKVPTAQMLLAEGAATPPGATLPGNSPPASGVGAGEVVQVVALEWLVSGVGGKG